MLPPCGLPDPSPTLRFARDAVELALQLTSERLGYQPRPLLTLWQRFSQQLHDADAAGLLHGLAAFLRSLADAAPESLVAYVAGHIVALLPQHKSVPVNAQWVYDTMGLDLACAPN